MYYIIITNSVYADKTLQDGAKILYGLILSLSQKDGYCYADNGYLADTLNKDPRTIQLYLSSLREKQYIHVDLHDNRVRRITTQDTRVRLKPIAKTPLDAKKRALNQLVAPEWVDEWYDDLKKWQEKQ